MGSNRKDDGDGTKSVGIKGEEVTTIVHPGGGNEKEIKVRHCGIVKGGNFL